MKPKVEAITLNLQVAIQPQAAPAALFVNARSILHRTVRQCIEYKDPYMSYAVNSKVGTCRVFTP
jgi:hypothetical protein